MKTADGRGVPGVRLRVQWEGGDDGFVTGMKPEVNAGYADYTIAPGKIYQITIGDGMTIVRDLSAPTCPAATPILGGQTPVTGAAGGAFIGSWRLEFEMR